MNWRPYWLLLQYGDRPEHETSVRQPSPHRRRPLFYTCPCSWCRRSAGCPDGHIDMITTYPSLLTIILRRWLSNSPSNLGWTLSGLANALWRTGSTLISSRNDSTKRLTDHFCFSWNFEAAARIFAEAKAAGKIPPEAFVKWKPSNTDNVWIVE